MIARRKHPARIAFPARFECCLVAFGAQQRMRQLNGKASLTDTRRTHEQIGARQPTRRQSPAKLLHYIIMSKNPLPHAKLRSQVSISFKLIIAEMPAVAKPKPPFVFFSTRQSRLY